MSPGLCLAAICLAATPLAQAAAGAEPAPATSVATSDFVRLPDAIAAEAWLAQNIPSGTALADRPFFFAAAAEAFYDADEDLLVFVFRSAAPGRWVAWVNIDPERNGVVSTDALDL